MNKYLDLLLSYCDRLVKNQITEMTDPHFHGGILCPACALIHGRIADAVYPLSAAYHYTKDSRYLECAKAAVSWSEHNLRRTDGSYYNDKMKDWRGITVFSAISFGEALLYHGDCLDEQTRSSWEKIHKRLTDFVFKRFKEPDFKTNINYFAAYASAMAIAYRLTENEQYRTAAYEMADRVLENNVTADGLIHGEGSPEGGRRTPKGSFGVDIGYNVEETLPALTAFAHYMQDEGYMERIISLWRTHLEFMLPDGGWDNSFGTRHNKWTYYGSRTSDGAQTGLCYIWQRDPVFAETAERNFEAMRRCSSDGYLYGGPMYEEAGEEPCIHHSFTHAKAPAALIDSEFSHRTHTALPREREYGLLPFPSINVNLVSVGDFRATVSGYDCVKFHAAATGGGSLTMLYHRGYGPVFASSVAKYGITEFLNMQHTRTFEGAECSTPRIQLGDLSSVNSIDCTLFAEKREERVMLRASGVLRDCYGGVGEGYSLEYLFGEDGLTLTVTSDAGGELILPVIGGNGAKASADGLIATLRRGEHTVELCSKAPITVGEETFNPVGGFLTAPFKISLDKGTPCTVTLRIK